MLSGKAKQIISLIALFGIFMGVVAYMDIQVMSIIDWDTTEIYDDLTFNRQERYWTSLGVIIVFSSVFLAGGYWATSPNPSMSLIIAVLLSGFIVFVSGLEDILYFAIAVGWLPSPHIQWSWMFQYKLFGTWNSYLHIAWCTMWLCIGLPAIWMARTLLRMRK